MTDDLLTQILRELRAHRNIDAVELKRLVGQVLEETHRLGSGTVPPSVSTGGRFIALTITGPLTDDQVKRICETIERVEGRA